MRGRKILRLIAGSYFLCALCVLCGAVLIPKRWRITSENTRLPLEGIRVVEFVHVIMGPSCGLVLADLGAEVIKVEPLDGDHTRKLTASGAGFFPTYNRNKKSIAVDLKSKEGRRSC